MVREAGSNGVLGFRLASFGGTADWRFLKKDSPDGPPGELPSGACEGLGNLLVTSESAKAHGVNELADHVGVSAGGRSGLDEKTPLDVRLLRGDFNANTANTRKLDLGGRR